MTPRSSGAAADPTLDSPEVSEVGPGASDVGGPQVGVADLCKVDPELVELLATLGC